MPQSVHCLLWEEVVAKTLNVCSSRWSSGSGSPSTPTCPELSGMLPKCTHITTGWTLVPSQPGMASRGMAPLPCLPPQPKQPRAMNSGHPPRQQATEGSVDWHGQLSSGWQACRTQVLEIWEAGGEADGAPVFRHPAWCVVLAREHLFSDQSHAGFWEQGQERA